MICALALLLRATLAQQADTAWVNLFNGRNLSGWDSYLSSDTANELVPNANPKNVFTVTNLEGENVIRVSGEVYGAITTHRAFDNMHFRLEFRWGEKRWPPRLKVGRDSGILYNCIGTPNPRTGWMTSVENNIMEKGVGQWWSVNGAIIDVEGEWITPENELLVPYKKEGSGERNIVYRPGAPLITASPANGITPYFDVEEVFGNWNNVEVLFWGGNCIHVLNGKVNLVAVNPRYPKNGGWEPLTSGRIQLQSEAAELFYRNIQARTLDEIPPEFLNVVSSPVAGEEGFIELFDPARAKFWKQSGPGAFTLQNGIAAAQGGMGLWWFSGRTFTNFVLRGEFLQEQDGADSGIFIRFPDPEGDPWVAVKKGHEVEIGDDRAENPTWRTGAIYPLKAPATKGSLAAGNWNKMEIVCREQDYSVRLNGKLVTTWTDRQKRSASGYVGLQNYDDGKMVKFRNLRIKELSW